MSVIGKAFLRYSRSILKPAINGLEPLQRVQKLEADVTHLIGVWRELLSVLDGKPDAINSNARLIRHLELHWRGGVRPSLNQVQDLFSEFAFHICAISRLQAYWHAPYMNSTARWRSLQKRHSMFWKEGDQARRTP